MLLEGVRVDKAIVLRIDNPPGANFPGTLLQVVDLALAGIKHHALHRLSAKPGCAEPLGPGGSPRMVKI
jgi:hypothetical protein